MCLEKPGPPMSGPGSKNPDPLLEVPVIVTLTEGLPCGTFAGEAELGFAGCGARGEASNARRARVDRGVALSVGGDRRDPEKARIGRRRVKHGPRLDQAR